MPFGRRRGYALLFSLMMLGMLAVMAAGLLALASTNGRTARRRWYNAQALNLAMGGLDEAVAKLTKNSDYTGFNAKNLGQGTVAVTVTTPASDANKRVVVATGTINAGQYTVTKQVRATMTQAPLSDVFYKALAAKSSFGINGAVDVASGPTLHVGDVHCNQDVTLDGSSVVVDGNVSASGYVYTTGSPTVTGTMQSGVPPMTFPDVDQGLKNMALADGITTGNVTVANGSLVKGKINGNLNVNGSGCQLNGVVWVTGDVKINAPVTGVGTIICDGKLEISASGTYPVTDVSRLAFITTNTDPDDAVDLGGNSQFKGIIYAPNGGVKLHGNPVLLGQIISNVITFSGNPDITRLTDVDANPPPLPKNLQKAGWEEL